MESSTINWYRTPVDKETLKTLTRRSDLKGALRAGSFLLIFVATTGISVFFFLRRMWIPMLISCYVHSLFHQMVGMAAAVHELSHGTPFKSKRANEFFYRLFCFLTWNNPVHFRASHMLHHQYTVYRGLDKEVIQGPVKKTMNWLNYVSWLTFDAKRFWLFMRANMLHVLGNGNVDFFSWDPLFAEDDPRRGDMIRWARLTLAGHLVIVGACVVLHLWVLIYLLVFGNFFATIIGRLTGATQHLGLPESTPDWRLVCHTMTYNAVARFLYWNMNYHIEHHMYAAIPCYNLPKFHEAVSKDLPHAPTSFAKGIALILSIKRKQRSDPSYRYSPSFPETAAPPRTRMPSSSSSTPVLRIS
jgi:fatty acid desaturase